MLPTIHSMRLALPFRMGSVNCYLIETGKGYVLIDTGGSNRRGQLAAQIEASGCLPGDIKLILITHGDFDHTGNAAYLRDKWAARIAMHPNDLGMAEQADMFFNRNKGNALVKALAPSLIGFRQADRFTPDILVEDGTDLSEFGFEARVLSLPGHSKGSIGILTGSGDLFCGDLLSNTGKPALNSIMDDPATAAASLEKLRGLAIQTVYPGHGDPFPMESLSTRTAS